MLQPYGFRIMGMVMKKLKIFLFSVIVLFASACTDREDTITVESLLDEMLSMDYLAQWPDVEYEQKQISSYDRTSVRSDEPEWFANDDGRGFIRVDTVRGRVEKVLFDVQHPGVITRIWNTTTRTKGTLRFYFDGHLEPDWIVPAYDFAHFGLSALDSGLVECHTNYNGETKGGNTFFLPIPFARSCKVTLEEPSAGVRYPRYYQFNYRQYPEGIPIETFSVEVAKRASEKIAQTCKALVSRAEPEGKALISSAVLEAGKELEIELPSGSRMVTALRISLCSDADYGRQMRQMILSASFDGVETVWVPLSDFSGAGLGAYEVHSRYMEADGKKTMTCLWPMPYRNGGRIHLKNISDTPSEVTIEVFTKKHRFTRNTLYFHASWRQECSLAVSNVHDECRDWDFATLKGRGIMRGDVLTLFNHSPQWYGEGDEKIYVDGESFPSHFGTGTEDYYNSSWAPVVPFHTAFGGAPRADLSTSHGYSSWCRMRSLDAIPFRSSLDFDLELISWKPGMVDYASTVYWYGDIESVAEGTSREDEARRDMPPAPENPRDYVIADNALEFEKSEIISLSTGMKVNAQDMSGFSDKWSRASHLLFRCDEPCHNMKVCFDGIPTGQYKAVLHATKARDYGIVNITLNDGTSVQFDGYSPEVSVSGPVDIGVISIDNGRITIEVSMIGKNAKSLGYVGGLDCITLEKV